VVHSAAGKLQCAYYCLRSKLILADVGDKRTTAVIGR